MPYSGMVNAGDQLQATLSHARQLAAACNRTVEVRFYKYTGPAIPSPNPEGRFYALQLFLIDPTAQGTTTVGTGRKVTLPNTVHLVSTCELSSLLDPSISTHVAGPTLGSSQPCGTNYTATTPPVNFATLVLQPSTAKVRLHRP